MNKRCRVKFIKLILIRLIIFQINKNKYKRVFIAEHEKNPNEMRLHVTHSKYAQQEQQNTLINLLRLNERRMRAAVRR